jgi:hypothetical protein
MAFDAIGIETAFRHYSPLKLTVQDTGFMQRLAEMRAGN